MSGGRMKGEVSSASFLVRKRGMKLFQILLGGLLVAWVAWMWMTERGG